MHEIAHRTWHVAHGTWHMANIWHMGRRMQHMYTRHVLVAGLEETWKAMLYKWRSHADIQEAERGLYALPWAPTAELLRQTLNITFAGKQMILCWYCA